jgi:hypothetical protein
MGGGAPTSIPTYIPKFTSRPHNSVLGGGATQLSKQKNIISPVSKNSH